MAPSLRSMKHKPRNLFSIGKMDHSRPGNGIHDSDDSSDISNGPSTVTFQTARSVVHGVINRDAPEYVEGVVNSYSVATVTSKTAAINGDDGETVPVQTIQVPFARDLTSDEELAQRASPQLSIGRRGNTQNMLNEPLVFQVQSDGVNLPEHASTGRPRRSSRKQNEVRYYEEPPRRQPKYKNARENPHKAGSSKENFTSLRIRAANCPFDEVEESE